MGTSYRNLPVLSSVVGTEVLGPIWSGLADSNVTPSVLKTFFNSGTALTPPANASLLGTSAGSAWQAITIGSGLGLSSNSLTATIATSSAVGVVKPSTDFSVAGDGTLSVANTVSSVAGAFAGWNAAGTLVAKTMSRTVSGTTVAPTADDDGVLILCTSSSAITVTANDFGVGHSCTIQQVGTGQPTITAGTGVTLVSPNASPSYKPSARYGALILTVVATNTVCVAGTMA